tara:strand:+ start:311 stop:1192 length:882 start_codon:yes stop_codon:yes gene_type:complete
MGRLAKLKRELILESNKRLLGEDKLGIEPVIDKSDGAAGYQVFFEEGKDTISDSDKKMAAQHLAKEIMRSLPTIERFRAEKNIPKFITIGSGTSSTGSRDRNAELGRTRMEEMKDIVFMSFDIVGDITGKYVAKDVIEDLITTNSNSSYKPSDLNPIYDRNRSLPRDMDRYGFVVISPLTTMGLDKKDIGSVGDKMRAADGYVYDEEKDIVDAIKKLETYSDIVDLDYELRNNGGLEGFINNTITDGLTGMGSDTEEREDIVNAINNAASNSGKGKVAKISFAKGGAIVSIML